MRKAQASERKKKTKFKPCFPCGFLPETFDLEVDGFFLCCFSDWEWKGLLEEHSFVVKKLDPEFTELFIQMICDRKDFLKDAPSRR